MNTVRSCIALLFACCLLLLDSCSDPGSNVNTDVIIQQLPPPAGWRVAEPKRPQFYAYKIERESGFAMIAVSHEHPLLFGLYDAEEYNDALELFEALDERQLTEAFHQWQAKQVKAKATARSLRVDSLAGVHSLVLDSDYEIPEKHFNVAVEYHIVKGSKGWIVIGLSCFREEVPDYLPGMNTQLEGLSFSLP